MASTYLSGTAIPPFVSAGRVTPMPARPAIPRYVAIDNQAELIPQVIAERLRREAYAHCDRAPFGWEDRL